MRLIGWYLKVRENTVSYREFRDRFVGEFCFVWLSFVLVISVSVLFRGIKLFLIRVGLIKF